MMTDATPMIAPSMVRNERTLFAASASSAMRRCSNGFMPPRRSRGLRRGARRLVCARAGRPPQHAARQSRRPVAGEITEADAREQVAGALQALAPRFAAIDHV